MIYCDTREKLTLKNGPGILETMVRHPILSKRTDEMVFRKLDLGDFLIERTNGSTLLIEKKTIRDFCDSLYRESGNGTFKSKLMRMSIYADERGLILEGKYIVEDNIIYAYEDNNLRPMIRYSQMVNFLHHRQQENCLVFFSNSLTDTLLQLFILHDDNGGSPSMKVTSWKQFLMLLPGIGKLGAETLIKKYNSPQEAFAHMNEWPRFRNLESGWR